MEKVRKGAAKSQQYTEAALAGVLWDDLRVFLACAGNTSFRAAAKEIKLDSATVVRRIERLETTLETQLFNRLSDGIRLTEHGERIVSEAKKMEGAAFDILRMSKVQADDLQGVVKIAITEGLGTYWLLPQLIEFQKTRRKIIIDMACTMTPADVGRLQADISIQFGKPERPDLITVRLGYLHIYPFMAKSYADQFGVPTSLSDIAAHRIIYQFGPLLDESSDELPVKNLDSIISFRTNVSTAVLYAIERGAGIGFLPSYASALAESLMPVNIQLQRRLEIWMTYHPNLRKSRRHQVVIGWLRQIFDARSFPCFGEQFIHPDSLVDLMAKPARVNVGSGYIAPFPPAMSRSVESEYAEDDSTEKSVADD